MGTPDRPHEPPYGNGGLLTYRVDDLKRRVDAYDGMQIPRSLDRLDARVKAHEEAGSIRDNRLWKIETTLEEMDIRGLRRDVQQATALMGELTEKVDGLAKAENDRTAVKGAQVSAWLRVPIIVSILLALWTFAQPFFFGGN